MPQHALLCFSLDRATVLSTYMFHYKFGLEAPTEDDRASCLSLCSARQPWLATHNLADSPVVSYYRHSCLLSAMYYDVHLISTHGGLDYTKLPFSCTLTCTDPI